MARASVEKFDVIIVGAGSAGCVIAARTSEDPNRTVLLLEAGPDYPDVTGTPYDLVNSHNNSYTDHDWELSYQPTRGRSVRFPRGRVTGGSSAVNTTIALRSTPEDHEEWAHAGNTEWTWDKVLPAYKRLERDLDFPDAPYHGDAGPISIRRYPPNELLPQQQAFLDTAGELDYAACADANAPDSSGAGPHPMNKLGRLRVSCAIAYLAPIRVRPNLTIRADTFVRRLVVERGSCGGVEVECADGTSKILRASLVVVAAGAIMSPAILMRSGLGPRSELGALSIEVRSDVPGMGKNLSDHPALAVVCSVKDGAMIDHDEPIIQTILRYTAAGSDKRNDLQIEQISFAGAPGGPPLFTIAAVLEYQHGRGELRLCSADPRELPIIDNRFCEDARDTTRLVQCFKDSLAFAKTGALGELVEAITFPDPRRPLDDESMANLCRKFAGSGYHPCGTVKMGPASDPMAVVDQYGCCHFLDGLAVADASIMPAVPRANTNLASIMIGEKVGEWLRTEPGRYGL